MESKMQFEKQCFLCGSKRNLELHHVIYGTGRRELAEEDGLTVWLCYEHHRGNRGIHFNIPIDDELKKMAQLTYERTHTREDFLHRYGRLYIPMEEEDADK